MFIWNYFIDFCKTSDDFESNPRKSYFFNFELISSYSACSCARFICVNMACHNHTVYLATSASKIRVNLSKSHKSFVLKPLNIDNSETIVYKAVNIFV